MIFLFLYICVRLLIYLSASAYLFACQSVRLLVSVYLCLAGFFTLSICHSLFSQSLLASLFISVSLCLYFFYSLFQPVSRCFFVSFPLSTSVCQSISHTSYLPVIKESSLSETHSFIKLRQLSK